MSNENIYNTGATYEQAVGAVATTLIMWDIHDTETHRRKVIKKLISKPSGVVVLGNWEERLNELHENSDEESNKIFVCSHDMKRVIFNYLYDIIADYAKRGRPEKTANSENWGWVKELADYYGDMSEDVKNQCKFGYAITESLNTFGIMPSIVMDGHKDDGSQMLGMAINWILNNREFRTGKLLNIRNIYLGEDGAKKIIAEKGLDKKETVPLTRDCFIANISEQLGKSFYITPNYFEFVRSEYAESEHLPYTFCKVWLEENKPLLDEILNIDGETYYTCINDDDILGTHEDTTVLDVIDFLSCEVEKWRYRFFQLMEECKKSENN